jgi:signal transduction histidine kinase
VRSGRRSFVDGLVGRATCPGGLHPDWVGARLPAEDGFGAHSPTEDGRRQDSSCQSRLAWKRSGNRAPLTSSDESREIRVRLIAIADSERRQAERALHEGVLQDMVAVSVRLQLARQLAERDPQGMLALIDEISDDLKQALERVRVLANEIYPSLLGIRGIAGSLRAAASAVGVLAEIDAAGLGRCDERIEAAVYFYCRAVLEAAERVSVPGRVVIRLERDEDAIRFEIATDSAAIFDLAEHAGMASDRIEALGGTIVVEPAALGRVVLSAWVPLAHPPSLR